MIRPSRANAAAVERSGVDLQTVQLLRRSRVFGGLPDTDLGALAKHCTLRHVDAGEILIRAGSPQQWVVYLVKGKVALYRRNKPRDVTLLLGLVVGPCLFGDAECAGEVPWIVSARAETAATLIQIPNAPFLACVSRHADLAFALYRDASIRHLLANATAQATALHDIETRLLKLLLLDYGSLFGRVSGDNLIIDHPITNVALAASLGVNRKTIERTLKPLETRGVLVREAEGRSWRITGVSRVRAALPADLLGLSSSLGCAAAMVTSWPEPPDE